jgi:diaminohydroxyphosphoribosylaminopyrimidine deaminase / 5-amino-6-(5-phosphoribosylamino)uracil reductase
MYNLTESQKELISELVRLIRQGKLGENFTALRDGKDGVFVQKPREKTGFHFSNTETQEFDALARTELLIVDVLEPRFGLLNCTLRGKAYEAVDSNFGAAKHPTPSAKKAMELAISIAKEADAEDARLHPKVGAVLMRDGQVLASAFRGELGPGDHAEFTLLQKKLFGENLRGSTLFTTLEPCTARKAHKTCAEWIVERKVGTVFVGMLDPNPRIYSLGITQLRESGVAIEFFPPELRAVIRADNSAFIGAFRANPELASEAAFNFTRNDGVYTIGHGHLLFETRWSNASNDSIHVYRDRTNLRGVGIARGAKSFTEVRDASAYDMSSRVQTPHKGEIIVLQNEKEHFAVLKIVDVRARSHGDTYDSVSIEYHINPDGSGVFRE